MTPSLTRYCTTLLASFKARDAGDIMREDDLLADLDKIWLAMTAPEREQSKAVAKAAMNAHQAATAQPAIRIAAFTRSGATTIFTSKLSSNASSTQRLDNGSFQRLCIA